MHYFEICTYEGRLPSIFIDCIWSTICIIYCTKIIISIYYTLSTLRNIVCGRLVHKGMAILYRKYTCNLLDGNDKRVLPN